jgi:hypothetical protein
MLHQYLKDLTREEIALLAALAGFIGVVLGSFVTALTAIVAPWIARRSEQKRQFRQMAIQAGLDNWRHQNELLIEVLKAGGKGDYVIDAPDDYIIHMLLLMDIASDPKLSPKEATDMIARKSRKPSPENPDAHRHA